MFYYLGSVCEHNVNLSKLKTVKLTLINKIMSRNN